MEKMSEEREDKKEQDNFINPSRQDGTAERDVVEVESLCMACQEQGVSRFLLIRVPHFRDLVISAFECPHCGYRNNSVESTGPIGEKGIKQSCLVSTPEDLNRQVVISEHAKVIIETVDLEIPPSKQKGYLSTIEGVLRKVVDDLEASQDGFKSTDPDRSDKLAVVVAKLRQILTSEAKCTFSIDDPSGNSYIESLNPAKVDPKLKVLQYRQSADQLREMGYMTEDQAAVDTTPPDSVYTLQSNCCSCGAPCEVRMHPIEIPHFRQVIIMASNCDRCGYKTNEVKSGGEISERGKRISLKIATEEDLNRDILKSETCTLSIPEISLEVTTGSLGGRFTTLEGLLMQVHDELENKTPFICGDSALPEKKQQLHRLLQDIEQICKLQLKCTVVLDDPLANSYLQNIYAPDEDPNMTIEMYSRTCEQDEELGLNDINTEDYNKETST